MRTLKAIHESLESLKGRTSDVRQMARGIRLGGLSQEDTIHPYGWMLMIPHGRNAPSGMAGPVPILVVGHEDIEPSDFREILYDLVSGQEKQITPPAGAIRYERDRAIDVRDLLFYGDLHAPFKGRFPESAEVLKQVVARIDDIASQPMASAFINTIKDEGVVSLKELCPYLDRLSVELVEPSSRPRTRGDLLKYSDSRFHNVTFRP